MARRRYLLIPPPGEEAKGIASLDIDEEHAKIIIPTIYPRHRVVPLAPEPSWLARTCRSIRVALGLATRKRTA